MLLYLFFLCSLNALFVGVIVMSFNNLPFIVDLYTLSAKKYTGISKVQAKRSVGERLLEYYLHLHVQLSFWFLKNWCS